MTSKRQSLWDCAVNNVGRIGIRIACPKCMATFQHEEEQPLLIKKIIDYAGPQYSRHGAYYVLACPRQHAFMIGSLQKITLEEWEE